MKRLLLILGLLLCTPGFYFVPTDVYVAQVSAGSADGSSCGNARAKSTLAGGDWAGDTNIHLCGKITGTAGQTAITAIGSGTSGHPITIVFEAGARLDNSAYWGSSTSGAITLSGQSWITVNLGADGMIDNLANGSGLANQAVSTGIYLNNCQHCIVQGSGGSIASMYRHTQAFDSNANALLTAGVKVVASSNVTVTGLRIIDAGNGILHSWSNGDGTVAFTNNTIMYSNQAIVSAGSGTLSGLAITGNDISDAITWFCGKSGTGICSAYRQSGIRVSATGASQIVTGLVVSRNYVHGQMGGYIEDWIYTGPAYGQAIVGPHPNTNSEIAHVWLEQSGSGSISGAQVFNNRLISGQTKYNFPQEALIVAGGTSLQIDNNTLIGLSSTVSTCLKFGPGNGNFQNNACAATLTGINLLAGATLTSNNNVFSGLSATATMISGISTYTSLAAWTTATSQDGSSTTGALLNDTAIYALKSGSSAINAGADLTSLGITDLDTDYLNVSRPSGSPWEVGAFEYSANSTDYEMRYYGLPVLHPGYNQYVLIPINYAGTIGHIYLSNSTGTANNTVLSGTPSGMTVNSICMSGADTVHTGGCFGPAAPYWFNYNTGTNPYFIMLYVQVDGSVAPGDYTIKFQVTVNTIAHTQSLPFRVEAVPSLPSPGTYTLTPIPGKANWESKMLSVGAQWCNSDGSTNPAVMSFGFEGFVWYYDGPRVFFQVGDYTHDSRWTNCAFNLADQYANLVNTTGVSFGNRVFTDGLRIAYERTGTQKYKDAIIKLATNGTPYATKGGSAVIQNQIRETAYILEAYINAERVGNAHIATAEKSVDFLLSMFDGLFKRHQYLIDLQNGDNQPFYDGIAAEALISYYENITPDPRIPPAIKGMLDSLYLSTWDTSGSFGPTMPYDVNAYGGYPVTQLNNLFVPAYAWYYKVTHNADPNYQIWGDDLWNHSLDQAITDKGKDYSQNYKWSFAYVTYRSATDPATANLSVPALTFPNTLAGQTASVLSVTLSNNGNAALHISSTTASGTGYTISANTCGATLASATSCTVSVTFTPASFGLKPGALTFIDDAGAGTTQIVTLSGLGIVVTLNPTSLTFGGTGIGVPTASQDVTLTNHVGSTMHFTSVLPGTNQYSVTGNTCGSSVADSASCTISLRFSPTSVGTKPDSLVITDDAAGSPRAVPLIGAGLPINLAGSNCKGCNLKGGTLK